MHHHLDRPDFGETQGSILLWAALKRKAVPVLFEGEAIVAKASSEAGITRRLSFLEAPKEVLKGPIHALERVLQDLRVHLG
jgi:hypothetical protein